MEIFLTLGISLGLGLLIGLQRERTEPRLGGIRTFPLISIFGTLCGILSKDYGGWIIVAGFLTVFAILALFDFLHFQPEESEPGLTTEVAALLTFALGAYLVQGERAVAVVVAGVMIVLLHLKKPMHHFVEKMGPHDMAAVIQFVVISLIVLPLLPNRAFGPFHVLNPFDIWRMVVLIVGISLAAYVGQKLLGQRAGALLGGALGGMISSVATTISYARRAKTAPRAWVLGTVVILIASAIVYVRVIVIVVIITPASLGIMAPPLGAMMAWMSLIAAVVYFLHRSERAELPLPTNPAEIRSALAFGVIYTIVLVATSAARQRGGSTALYGVSAISGLADLDAITLSVSRMVARHHLAAANGWQLVLVASLSNLAFKGVVAGFLGGWRVASRLALCFGLGIIGGFVIFWLWPAG